MKKRENKYRKLLELEVREQFPNDADLLRVVKKGDESVLEIVLPVTQPNLALIEKEILFHMCRETGALK